PCAAPPAPRSIAPADVDSPELSTWALTIDLAEARTRRGGRGGGRRRTGQWAPRAPAHLLPPTVNRYIVMPRRYETSESRSTTMTSYPSHDGPGGRRRRRPRRGAPDAATGFPGSPEFPGAPFAGPAFHHDPPEDGPFGHHRGHRRGRFGPGGFGPGGFGPGGFGPGYGPRGRGRGRGRGDVRAAILVLL